MGRTLFDKIWDQHTITGQQGEPQLLYIDLHLKGSECKNELYEDLI